MSNPREQARQAQFEAFTADPEATELLSPGGLSARERKAWHLLAEAFGLHSASVGEGLHRCVRVSKAPIGGKPSILNTTGMRRFREDFGLKINLADAGDFEYFVDLYDAHYGAREHLAQMKKAMEELGGEKRWKDYLQVPRQAIWDAIKAAPGWAAFDADDMSSYKAETEAALGLDGLTVHRRDPFVLDNDGRCFVSFDLRSANFNGLKFYDPGLTLGCETWGALLDRFIDLESRYFHTSKLFRQKVFWNLHPTRQMTVAGALISRTLKALHEAATQSVCGPGIEIHWNKDEVILALPDRVETLEEAAGEASVAWSVLEAHPLTASLLDRVRLEVYRVRVISKPERAFVKEHLDGVAGGAPVVRALPDFIRVNPSIFAVVYKHYSGLALDPRDLKLSWDAEKKAYSEVDVASLRLEAEVRWPGFGK